MAGKLIFDSGKAMAIITERIKRGARNTAEDVLDEAIALAPSRKNRKARGHTEALGLTKKYRIGGPGGRGKKAQQIQGAEIYKAAKRIGITAAQLRGGRIRTTGRSIQGAASSRTAGELRRGTAQIQAASAAKKLPVGSKEFQTHVERVRLNYRTRNAGRGATIRESGRIAFGGFLKKHIHLVDMSTEDVIRFSIRSEAPYSRYVEFPTRRTAAQPFMLPALKRARGSYRDQLKRSWR